MRSYFKGTARNEAGDILASATISVYLAGTVTPASIYTTLSGAVAVNSVTSAADGTFSFYVSFFDYDRNQKFKIIISKTGETPTTWDNLHMNSIVIGTYAIADDTIVTTNLGYIPNGVLLAPATGKTLTISGKFDAGNYQVFSGAGTVAGLKESNPYWFGAKIDNATDDTAAWQAALDSIVTTGGVVHWPIGTSYCAGSIIWPNNGTDSAYAIRLIGQSPAPTAGVPASHVGGVSAIRYDGTGNLFDMRNGGTTLKLNWYGSIENGHLWGPGEGSSIGIYFYSMKRGTLKNLQIHSFGGYGIYGVWYVYYSIFENVHCLYNGVGAYFAAPNFNSTKLHRCMFSRSTTGAGLRIAATGGYPITIDGSWFEGNATSGVSVNDAALVNVQGSYFENNGGSDIIVSVTGFYNATVNLYGNFHYETNPSNYAVFVGGVSTLNSIGCRYRTYDPAAKAVIGFSIGIPRGIMSGNVWPEVENIYPMNRGHYGNFSWDGTTAPSITIGTGPMRYSTIIQKGSVSFNNDISTYGGVAGWLFTSSGAGSLASLVGITATTESSNKTITVNSISGLYVGSVISIAGVTFGSGASNSARIVKIPSMTTIVVTDAPNEVVTDAAVSFHTATYKPITGVLYDVDNSAVSSSGTGEDDLQATVIPAGMMTVTSGFKVFAAGTKSGANNNKTLKFYFGATSVTFHAAANNTNDWRFEAYVYNTGAANKQGISWVGYDGTTILQGYNTATIDTTATVKMKITGECANGSDTITQTLWLVEPM